MFFIISTFFYKIFGIFGKDITEFSVRFVSPLASTIMVVYTFLLTKKLFNSKTALYAIIFLSFIPDFIYKSALPYFDVLVALFVLLSTYYILKDKIVWSSIFMAFALLTKYNALFAIPIPVMILCLKYRKELNIFLKKSFIYLFISCSVGSICYIRNWILLGNSIFLYFESVSSSGRLVVLYINVPVSLFS